MDGCMVAQARLRSAKAFTSTLRFSITTYSRPSTESSAPDVLETERSACATVLRYVGACSVRFEGGVVPGEPLGRERQQQR